jgi:hypothetical protein
LHFIFRTEAQDFCFLDFAKGHGFCVGEELAAVEADAHIVRAGAHVIIALCVAGGVELDSTFRAMDFWQEAAL